MWTDGNGFFYQGDCRLGDRLATDAEVSAWTTAKPKPTLSFDQFLALFTATEQSAIFASADPKIRIFLFKAAATPVDLSRSTTKAAVNYLVTNNLLTSDRAAAVMSGAAPGG